MRISAIISVLMIIMLGPGCATLVSDIEAEALKEVSSAPDPTPELIVKKITSLKVHKIYFKGSRDRLDVYQIKGMQPGKTILLIGGIHGNEPGGYLGADKFVDIDLAVGNLIVVPRANLETIRANHRGIHGDMNRKFPNPDSKDRNAKAVEILKKLIDASDVVLNLHDGSGFYSSKWVDSSRNPNKFGQSLIIDRKFWKTKSGQKIELLKPALNVAKRVNKKIQNSKHHFHVNNTQTGLQNDFHPGMKFTATYHSLVHSGVAAFGVETSKSLPNNRMKVLYQTMIIDEFMKEYGIHSTLPLPESDEPKVEYILVGVNKEFPVALRPGNTIEVPPNSTLRIVDLKGNSKRGFFFKDSTGRQIEIGESFSITQSQKIEIRKDAFTAASFNIKILEASVIANTENKENPISSNLLDKKIHLLVSRNGKKSLVQFGESVNVLEGDEIIFGELTGVSPDRIKNLKINVVGFVGNRGANDGEDRGYVIKTDQDLIQKWATPGPGHASIYRVVLSENKIELGYIQLKVMEPEVKNAVIESSDGEKQVLNISKRMDSVAKINGNRFKLLSPIVSAADPSMVRVSFEGKELTRSSDGWWGDIKNHESKPLKIFYGKRLLGSVQIHGSESKLGR